MKSLWADRVASPPGAFVRDLEPAFSAMGRLTPGIRCREDRMELSEDLKDGLGVAFEEAALLGAEFRESDRVAAVTLALLTLPESGPPPKDSRVQVRLTPVGRLAASLRLGDWNDPDAAVVPFTVEDLLPTVQSFGGLPIYGREFFDVLDQDSSDWLTRLSLSWTSGTSDGHRHTMRLFQAGAGRHLDLCIWFDALSIIGPAGDERSIDEVIAGGLRWWDALYRNDPRTTASGIIPLKRDAWLPD